MNAASENDVVQQGPAKSSTLIGEFAFYWGAIGFIGILLLAVFRLTPISIESLNYDWDLRHWLTFVVNLIFMAYSEGYRGFQKSYSPRLAARAIYLKRHATVMQALLSPLVCMGFINAPKKRIIGAWLLTIAIVVVVVIYRSLPQPWRGILDAGVVVGLAWGSLATVYWVWKYFPAGPTVDPEFES